MRLACDYLIEPEKAICQKITSAHKNLARVTRQTSATSGRLYIFDSEYFISGDPKFVPNQLVQELASLRFDFANLLRNYENELQKSPEAQEKFVLFLPRLFRRAIDSIEEHNFQSHFQKLIEEEVSLFNICYLKRICGIFPEDVR